MTPQERYLTYVHKCSNDAPMCSNCRYYMQHFILQGVDAKGQMHFAPVRAGHCTEPRIKTRMPFDLCTHYEPKEGSCG